MQRTEQSKRRAGHEQDRTSPLTLVWSASAETLELEDMAQAFGARIPASLDPFSADETSVQPEGLHGLHPFS